MKNIILFLLHFSIISHFKSIESINTQLSHGRFKNSNCFISNLKLYNNTLTNDLLSNKSTKKHIKSLESDRVVKESPNDGGILLESPSSALKSIVDKGSIKSSSIRHEILDKQSLLDELIVSKDDFKGLVEDLDKTAPDSLQKGSYIPKKFEEVFKVLESSVLKKTVDKKEQVIKPSDKILKRRSKETIYTRLQNYVKSSEPFLNKHNLLEEVKNFVHLFHWNVWHAISSDGKMAWNWTGDQFSRFESLIEKIDQIINDELESYLLSTRNTDQDLIEGVLEERTNFKFSSHYVYNKLREIVELGEFDVYRDRMIHLSNLKCKIIGSLKKMISCVIFDPRETYVYRRARASLLQFKNHLRNLKYKMYSKLNKTRIFMNKFPTPNTESRPKNVFQIDYKPDEFPDSHFDKINLQYLLRYLSHSYISPQNLRKVGNIGREDLYKLTQAGNWTLYFVGSGSRQPTNTRLTSTMAFKKNSKGGPIWLFDCGEGTKTGLEKLGLDPSQVEKVFLTHLHGDHCYGIFSFLYLRERPKPLEIYGPPGTRKLINAIHQNTSTSTYSLFVIHELLPKGRRDSNYSVNSPGGSTTTSGDTRNTTVSGISINSYASTLGSATNSFADRQNTGVGVGSGGVNSFGVDESGDVHINNEGYYNVFRDDSVEILAADLEHTMPTVGYVIQQRSQRNSVNSPGGSTTTSGGISVSDRLNAAGSSNNINNPNANRNNFESMFNKHMYFGGPKTKEVKKIVICQDSSDSSKMKKIAMNADILIHEATISSTTSLVSGVLLDIIRDNNDLVLSKGSIRKLYNFLSNIETKLGCFNFTLSALSSFVKCERYYLLQKLNVCKNFISNFKPLDKELSENKNALEGKNKKEVEKKLKDKWLNNVFAFMDRLNALNELNKNEYFVNRLQNRYKLMEKLSKVLPTLDLNKVIDTASRRLMFSKIVQNHGAINHAYERYEISNKYRDMFIVDVPKYLNSVSGDIFEYWNDILQLELSSQSDSNFEDSIDENWNLLYDSIIGSFGHSTPNMAGKFASEINAKKLILTHFSNKYPGDEKFEHLLTMIRIENEARMAYANNGSKKFIPVIAAWDKMKLKL